MAKGQLHSNREAKKPKQPVKAAATPAMPTVTPSRRTVATTAAKKK